MSEAKDKSPNKEIDKALKDLLKSVMSEVKGEEFAPDEVTAKVRVIQTAISWEKVKHQIKDDDEFDMSSL